MKKITTLHTWDEFDAVLREIALIDLDVAHAERARSLKIIEAQSRFDELTKAALAKRAILAEELELFYVPRRKEVEAEGKRSKELRFGRAGMRKGNKILKTLKGWTWDKVAEAMAGSRLFADCVSTKPVLDKNAVKKLESEEALLEEMGVRIQQSDEFFFETFPDKAVEA